MSRTNCAIGKDYVPASFKGVLFYCTEASVEGGRRGAEGEFPFGEDTAYADLGRKIRVYNLTAAFREDNHVWDSQALFDACESPQPGLLVHPTRGTVMAACRKCKVNDKIEDAAGETTAELEFVEANEVGRGLGGSIFGIISTAISAISQASFLSGYTPVVVPHPWTRDVVNTAQRMSAVNAVVSEQVLAPEDPTPLWRKVQYMHEVERDDALAAIAVNVDKNMRDGFYIVTSKVQDPKPRYEIFRRVANTAVSKLVFPPGPAHTSEQAVLSRQRILAGIGMAEAALGRKYNTLEDGLATMDAVLAVLDDEARAAYAICDNALYLEIRKYAAEFAQMMNDLSYRLPSKIWVNFSGGVHPLVASYAIYKDAKRHRDLELRNVIDANGRIGPIVSGLSP